MDAVYRLQQVLHEAVGARIAGIAATRDWTELLPVLGLGIVFGALHAVTPGHSKMVLASYLVGSRLAWLRGLGVAGALALTHITSAVLLALAAAPLISRTVGGAGRAPALEVASRVLLAAIGLWLIVRALRHRPHVHHEGVLVGVAAGIIPCPLTLFAMFLALSKGVLAVGLIFAFSMMLGVALTLGLVTIATVSARDRALEFLTRRGASIARVSQALDLVTGVLLFAIGLLTIYVVSTN